MNLLTDAWIPVREKGVYQEVTFEDILCKDQDWKISCPRDDFELATLQLLISLTQVVFLPQDIPSLRKAEQQPLEPRDYKQAIQGFIDWFDLLHPTQPFMQVRGVKSKEVTPIQKLFVGLPEGNNPAYFNAVGEVKQIGLNYAAIALFNQASNSPSFGGGFKGSLRGGAPINLFIQGDGLRQTIWRNILCKDILQEQGLITADDVPNWVRVVQTKEKVYPHEMGICRGLFWQPAHVELQVSSGKAVCDCSGNVVENYVTGFNKEKFDYQLMDIWSHPHSPRKWVEKKTGRETRFSSFTTTAPAWTQLSAYVAIKDTEKEGSVPPLTITQYRQAFRGQSLSLVAGGYRNKQALILQRRHEQISLAQGWEEHADDIREMIDLALSIRQELTKKLFGFAKGAQLPNASGISNQGQDQFYLNSESEMHALFKALDFDIFYPTMHALSKRLCQMAISIFEDLTRPYRHSPKMIEQYVSSKSGLRRALRKIESSYQTEEVL